MIKRTRMSRKLRRSLSENNPKLSTAALFGLNRSAVCTCATQVADSGKPTLSAPPHHHPMAAAAAVAWPKTRVCPELLASMMTRLEREIGIGEENGRVRDDSIDGKKEVEVLLSSGSMCTRLFQRSSN